MLFYKWFVGVYNGKAEQPVRTQTANGANKLLVLHMPIMCDLLSIPVSLLANEFYVGSVLLEQVSLAAVNHIYLIHKNMNCCKNLKIH